MTSAGGGTTNGRRRSLHISVDASKRGGSGDNVIITPRGRSPSPPLTGPSFRHRMPSVDTELQRTEAGYSELRVEILPRSKASGVEVSTPLSTKTPYSAVHFAEDTPRSGRLSRLLTPRTSLSHSFSDAPLSATPALLDLRERRSIYERVKPWTLPALWVVTTLGFLLAIAFWRKEVFSGLEHLAAWLRTQGWIGYFIMFGLIFITTIPPLPMYSTLIILSGYCFGTWVGAVISYTSALTGAIVVFLLSRAFFPGAVTKVISASPSFKRIIRAIEKRPRLLFLIRLAPYPYNMMNVLLSSSSVLTFQTYTLCTALSLFKCIIYTALGSSIHSFADFHTKHKSDGADAEQSAQQKVARIWGVVGILLCVGIFAYLSWLARRAVDDADDEEEDGEDAGMIHGEEARPFINASTEDRSAHELAEVPFRSRAPIHQERAGVGD